MRRGLLSPPLSTVSVPVPRQAPLAVARLTAPVSRWAPPLSTTRLQQKRWSSRQSLGFSGFARGARTRAVLFLEEWQDRLSEWRERAALPGQRMRQADPAGAATSMNAAMESMHRGLHRRGQDAIVAFDDEFNRRWYIAVPTLRGHAVRLWQRLGGTGMGRKAEGDGPPLDMVAMALVGLGVGGATQGYPWLALLTLWGASRGVSRFTVQRLDADDMVGLFRFTPSSLLPPLERRVEIFGRLKRELEVARGLRAGNMDYADMSWIGSKGTYTAMHPELDYTPESLFADAMRSVAEHPRVQQLLGEDVQPEAEPDKVVYRIHEGIAEVYLGWQVVGTHGTAEVQVKATASIVDFIYVFPRAGNRYEMTASGGFVIRPQGTWSMDCSDLPSDQKRPFGGEASGRLHRNREGTFEWDWSVREFRHGYEADIHPRSKKRTSWW